jgi:cobalt-zinc-cadmium efflux system outer membrane protein
MVMRLILVCATSVFLTGPMVRAGAASTGFAVWDQLPDSTWTPGDTLTFERALFRVRQASPLLAGLSHHIRAGAARVDQAGAWPNPNLSFDVENAGGSYNGLDRSEITLDLSQEIPLGGQLSHRRRVTQSEAGVAALDACLDAFDLYVAVARRYAAVTHAEARLRLIDQAHGVLQGLAGAADERVRAGAALVADRLLGEAAVERASIARDEAQSQAGSARRSLAFLWSAESGFPEPLRARTLPRVASDSLIARAARGPAVQRVQLDLQHARATHALEKSLRVPSITADAGFRRVEVDDANTFVMGVGIPLPVLDRRRSAVEASAARARGLEQTLAHARAEARREVAERVVRLERLIDRARRTDAVLLPAQRTALDALREAYAIGRVSYSDLLESQRNYIELQLERNDFELAIAEETLAIEMLIGAPIEETSHE